MLGLSEQIIKKLTDITASEGSRLPEWTDKNYVAKCLIPPLSGENNVHCNIAVVAPVSAGKSTLFNSLCGYPILPVASKTTSSVPTYITRVNEKSHEGITVYGIKKEVTQEEKNREQGITSTRYVKDPDTMKSFSAKDISRDMFDELFEYMYFVTHGVRYNENEFEYMTTVENVAYFMKDTDKVDVLFNGMDAEKWSIGEDDFALSYYNPRHRLLLLLILLCVYVNQNDDRNGMGEYTKEVNEKRDRLFQKYKLPIHSDYCVYLDWCNDDIPEDVTLIDLPGTGASTQDSETQSSHTALVRGILTEADAVWVLCSDNGAVDVDLLYALKDAIEGNSRKNKVCIYNCKNSKPNDSGPVIDFLKKLPCLTGERCYVVDALAGEYKYTQNGVNAVMTKTASDRRCISFDDPDEAQMAKILAGMYRGQKRAYCTFTSSKDAFGSIIAVQDGNHRYTLESFFKSALADYIERLKYEVSLSETIAQAKFYVYIRDSLSSSRSILECINGKGEEISNAVDTALRKAKNEATNAYIAQMAAGQSSLASELNILAPKIGDEIRVQFVHSLDKLIENLKNEWRSLTCEGSPNCLKANFWGNYPLSRDNPNRDKFDRVRSNAKNMITISAFDGALSTADTEIKKYQTLLIDYVNSLKKITEDFVTNYVNAFLSSFDAERDRLIPPGENQVTSKIYKDFNNTREKLRNALENKLNAMCTMVCDSFDILVTENGTFATLRKDTDAIFRDKFCENILDRIRNFMDKTFNNINYITWLRDCVRPEDLQKILNDDFTAKKKEYSETLVRLIETMYAAQPETEEYKHNFPNDLSVKVNQFNADKLFGANNQIDQVHDSVTLLIGYKAGDVVDLSIQLKELADAIAAWNDIGEKYKKISVILEDSDAENTKILYNDCKSRIDTLIPVSEP